MMTIKRKRVIKSTSRFKRDVRKSAKQDKDIALLQTIINLLADDIPLEQKYYDHSLTGKWKDHRECHISPDWLLIYKKTDNDKLILTLVRVGSHSDLDL